VSELQLNFCQLDWHWI